MNSDELRRDEQAAPLWRLAFRPGFLLAAVFGVLAMARWLLWTHNPGAWQTEIPAHWWHAHEMIFGFAMPVVAGFLLSAVATWTGIAGTTGKRLQLLFGLWLLARILLWMAPSAAVLAWLAEMGFIAGLMFELTKRVWARRQWRNMLFPPILAVLAILDSISYLTIDDPLLSTYLHYGALWMITLLVVIVGGRVIPLFTGNRLGLRIAAAPPWLEYSAIGSVALVGLISVTGAYPQSNSGFRALCLAAFAIQLYRLSRWQGWKTTGVPLLWSMHLSYLCIPLSLLGLALAGDNPVAAKNILHLLAIGTVGGMILSMMSRVSLGHTGRPMETPNGLPLAFALLFIAAILRAALPLIAPELTLWAWRISAGLWLFAFAVFAVRYYPILSQPRADGKPG